MKTVRVILLLLTSLSAFSQEEGKLLSINGTKLFVRSVGQGEPVIVIHGGPGLNHEYLFTHLKPLGKKIRLIFYDQRACGRSEIPSTDSLSLKFFADDIEAIRKFVGAEKVTLLAHSWGAIPAVQYSLQYRHRMKGLIVCNPIPLSKEYDQEMLEVQRSRFTGKDSTDRSIIIGSPSFKAGKSSAYTNLMRYSFRHSFYEKRNLDLLELSLPENYVKASQALYTGLSGDLSGYNYYDQLKTLEFKVLIIHGQSDAIPIAALTRMHDQLPNATLLFFNKSGHFAFIEQQKKFISEVLHFINK